MKGARRIVPILIVAGCLPAFAGGGDGLEAALKKHYKLATVRLNLKGGSVLEPGTVLAIRKEGIVSFAENDSSYATLCPSEIKAGVVHTPKTSLCTTLAPKSRRMLRPGETVCVTSIDVSSATGTVSFLLATCGPVDSNAARHRALVEFRFPDESLAQQTPAAIEDKIRETLAESEVSLAASDAVATPVEDQQPAVPIAVGQTIDEVRTILGPPDIIADLGPKTVYIYSTVKVFFLNGKVSSIKQPRAADPN